MSVWVKRALGQVLDEISGEYPDNLALIFKNQRISYRMLREKTRTLAKGLMALGVGRGDKVSIWGGNCPEWIYTQMATALIGAVLVPVNTRFRTSELEYILSQSDSTTLVLMEMGSEMGSPIPDPIPELLIFGIIPPRLHFQTTRIYTMAELHLRQTV
jgi:fatty-acyl-CoA synthase